MLPAEPGWDALRRGVSAGAMRAPTDETRFGVRLTPRGGLDRVDGVADGTLRARVAAPAVDGAANVITAAVCALTGQQPAAVCGSAGVVAAAAKLPHLELKGVQMHIGSQLTEVGPFVEAVEKIAPLARQLQRDFG